MTDKKTISVYDSQVDKYAEMLDQLPIDNFLLEFISKFQSNDYVLDLGCGPAVSSAIMRDHGLRVDPTDASEEMVKLANKRFNIGARIATFNDLIAENSNKNNTLKSKINSKELYDGIWANFSLLHATPSDFPKILKALHRVLKTKGLLHIGMKIGRGSSRDKLGRYYSYYSQDELQLYLKKSGFDVEKISLNEDIGLAGEVEPWIAIISYSD